MPGLCDLFHGSAPSDFNNIQQNSNRNGITTAQVSPPKKKEKKREHKKYKTFANLIDELISGN